VLRSGLRRISVMLVVIAALTAAVSVVLGALAHANLERALADGFYIVGVAILAGSFFLGIRGPLRADWGDVDDPPRVGMFGGGMFPRRVRPTTPEERVEARRNSLALFALGIVFILIGGSVDPTRRVF
jgi:hypothetical protein